MKPLYLIYNILCVMLLVSNQTSAHTTQQHNHHIFSGLKITLGAGAFAVLHKMEPHEQLRAGPSIETGLEYGTCFGNKQQYYIGGSILFNGFVPDAFKYSHFTILGKNSFKFYPVLFPIFDVLIGYNISPKHQLVLGSTYTWGATIGYRHAISNNTYIYAQAVWWLDRIFMKLGIHDAYAVVGIGWSF